MPPRKKKSGDGMPLVAILNGPNLKQLGRREPHIYGSVTWPEIETQLKEASKILGVAVEIHHESHEGHLIEILHNCARRADAIVLNPGGLGHVSIALRDAVAMCPVPVIEVHVSNLAHREPFRSHSYVSAVSSGIIMGFGVMGYEMALWAAHKKINEGRRMRDE
jgi:3-dehydroquinate dehydratase-2